jgi:hypothetical protein
MVASCPAATSFIQVRPVSSIESGKRHSLSAVASVPVATAMV